MRQANELRGYLCKGEESAVIVFRKMEDRRTGDEGDTETRLDGGGQRFVFRYYRVRNCEQCQLPERALAALPKVETHQHDPAVAHIVSAIPDALVIEHGGTRDL